MNSEKKSFVFYNDWKDTFDEISDEQSGKLIKHILSYVVGNKERSEDPLINAVFMQIRNTIERDQMKYEKYIQKQKQNGSKGGRPKKPNETQKSQAFSEEPKKADSVSDSVSDNDILLEKETKVYTSQHFKNDLIQYGFEKKLVDEWIKVRRGKKMTDSETAFKMFIKEVEKTPIDKNEILMNCVSQSWGGFKSAWILKMMKEGSVQKTVSKTIQEKMKQYE
jgi:hypothetical protein